MGIRSKFIIALSVILCLGGGLMMAGLYHSSYENVRQQAIENADTLADSFHDAVYEFMRAGDQTYLDSYLKKGNKIHSVAELRIVRSALLEKDKGVKKDGYVKDDLDQQALRSRQVMRKTVTVGRGEAIRIISPAIADKTCMACHAVKEGDVMALLRTTLVFQSSIDAMKRNLLEGGLMQALALLFVIGAIFIWFERLMVSPLKSLTAGVDSVSTANLTQEVKVRSHDEIGRLAARFNGMTAELKNIIKKVQEATGQITVSSNEILITSREQAATAREQSSAVTETTVATKELSATSESIVENMRDVAQMAAHALAGMSKTKNAISKTNDLLAALGEKSKKIGAITEVIDDVADRTNLLAVNASIEAALAGEQGWGFTVVADEIRKLADSTARSTKDITALIELIRHEISDAITSMEQSVKSVDEETQLAQQTMEKTKEIAMSTHQQISGSKQIADAMRNIDEAMRRIAAGAAQSQSSVKQLNGLAGELKQLASKFKL